MRNKNRWNSFEERMTIWMEERLFQWLNTKTLFIPVDSNFGGIVFVNDKISGCSSGYRGNILNLNIGTRGISISINLHRKTKPFLLRYSSLNSVGAVVCETGRYCTEKRSLGRRWSSQLSLLINAVGLKIEEDFVSLIEWKRSSISKRIFLIKQKKNNWFNYRWIYLCGTPLITSDKGSVKNRLIIWRFFESPLKNSVNTFSNCSNSLIDGAGFEDAVGTGTETLVTGCERF